jgi:hypothetical protein
MAELHRLNAAVAINRADLERVLESLASLQQVSSRAAALLLDRLDTVDGDADAETTGAEDDFAEHGQRPWYGPGCEIGDAPEKDVEDAEHDGREPDGRI